jgi:hypothetical protein
MKTPLRPSNFGTDFNTVAKTTTDSADRIRLANEEALQDRPSVVPVVLSDIVEFATNPRHIPIPLHRFICLEWPDIADKNLETILRGIVSKEELHEDYDVEKAVMFYMDVYSLSHSMDNTGQLQSAALLEHVDGLYTLVFGQRRFMASFIRKARTLMCAIYNKAALIADQIHEFQDAENEQRSAHSFPDFIRSKRTLYVKHKPKHDLKRDLAMQIGMTNRNHYSALFTLYERSDEDAIMKLIVDGEITSMRALISWISENPETAKVVPPVSYGRSERSQNVIDLRSHCIFGTKGLNANTLMLRQFAKLYLEKFPELLSELGDSLDVDGMPTASLETLLLKIARHNGRPQHDDKEVEGSGAEE